MKGNGKLELILYQYRSEMSFRATYGISFLGNTLKEPIFSEGRWFEPQTSFTYLNFNKQYGPTSSLVVEIKYSVSNEINSGLLQATVSMKFLSKITFSGKKVRCKCQVSRSMLVATNTNLDHLKCFQNRGNKKKRQKRKKHFSWCVCEGHAFLLLQLMMAAGHKLTKVCCDYCLRQCNLVIWATEQYKAWSNSEKMCSKMSTRYSAGKAVISSVVRLIELECFQNIYWLGSIHWPVSVW